MILEPYLFFSGECEEALNFYKSIFGGEILFLQRYEGSPMEGAVEADFKTKVMHATYKAPTFTIMAADSMHHAGPGARVALSLGSSDVAESQRIFAGLTEGGTITMALEKTFWAKAFGSLTDRYGVDWMVNCN